MENIKAKEARIVKGVIACEVSHMAFFCCLTGVTQYVRLDEISKKYLSQIANIICLKLQKLFVSNFKHYLS